MGAACWRLRRRYSRLPPRIIRRRRSGRAAACSTGARRSPPWGWSPSTGAFACAACWMSSPVAKLLVTGGAGFIGSNFVHHWLEQRPGDRLVVLDALTYAGNLANLKAVLGHQQLRFVHGNIGDA